MNDWKASVAAKKVAAAALAAANPHLVSVAKEGDSLRAAAKNIRIELGRAFPGVKFSVKSRRFSGGDAIDVGWIDGPVSAQVDAIIDRYSGGSFDGMQDIYTYSRDAWTDAFGDAKYVHSRRDYSDKAVASAIRSVVAKYGEAAAVATIEAYSKNQLWNIYPGGGDWSNENSLQSMISAVLYSRTWALTKPYLAVRVAVDAEVA